MDLTAPITVRPDGTRRRHRLAFLTRHDPRARKILHSQRYRQLGKRLGGPDYWMVEDTLLGVRWQMKSGGKDSAYSSIDWHFDFPTGHMLTPAFTAGTYLDASRQHNGCLELVPMSHNQPLRVEAPETLLIEVDPGDLVCHHDRVFHGAGPVLADAASRATIYHHFSGAAYPGPNERYRSRIEPDEREANVFKSAAESERV